MSPPVTGEVGVPGVPLEKEFLRPSWEDGILWKALLMM